MESHDHLSPVGAAMPHEASAAPTENMTAQGPDAGSQEQTPQATPGLAPGQQTQAPPADGARAAFENPSAQTGIPNQQSQTVSQFPQFQTAGQQTQFQPNVIMDSATGRLYYAMPQGQPVPPPPQNGQYVYYTQAPPEPAPDPRHPDYAQIIKSVEDFAEGDASVADVVKTLWTETSQDDQFWKGAVVGAAAAFLLTSGTVRGAMGKTFGSLFGKNTADTATSPSPGVDPGTN
ncbi:hypothetical protein [uncultured Desulfobacter sp.]|uniref:hypothetical protein n=1 Tax=uncultured Desulfobacter sp. TaxID=240139 RepID=UPI002AAB1364|nr:hypothetical protein [uncultured Desulfobacter sp.]